MQTTIPAYKVIRISENTFAIAILEVSKDDIFRNNLGYTVCKKVFVKDIVDKNWQHVADKGYSYWNFHDNPNTPDFEYVIGKFSEDNSGLGLYFFKTKEEVIEYIKSKYYMQSFFE